MGLENIQFFVRSGALLRIVPNTVLLNLLFLSSTTPVAVLAALALNEIRCRLFKRVAQSVMFLPYFVSWIVVGVMLQSFLAGQRPLVNQWLAGLDLGQVSWYFDPK
ncbi:MAG: hypothetical protein QME94_19275 [Anaerolineae bacterium]|nr:hypothetical protein [Anaerolineae bacterium]